MKIKLILIFLTISNLQVLPQTAQLDTVLYNGTLTNPGNTILFIPDGFTDPQLGNFVAYRNRCITAFEEDDVFGQFTGAFNIFSISIASEESGAGQFGSTDTVHNYFGSVYNYEYIAQRLVRPLYNDSIVSVLNRNGLPSDNIHVVVIVNIPERAGYGDLEGFLGNNARLTTIGKDLAGNNIEDLFLHEFGHAYGLGDEYEDPGIADLANDPLYDRPNVTSDTITLVGRKWGDNYSYIEGANFNSTGWFRSHQYCKMRTVDDDFCGRCADLIEAVITQNPTSVSHIEYLTDHSDQKPVEYYNALGQRVPTGCTAVFCRFSDGTIRKKPIVVE